MSLVIPGVSGGTLAIILGFYNQLIEAIGHFMTDFRRHVKFLLPFGFGIIIGLVAFASVIRFLLDDFAFPAMMFFIGLIAGVIPGMYKEAQKHINGRATKADWVKVLIPFGLLVLLAHLNRGAAALDSADVITLSYMVFLFVIGIIAAASLLIPGLSGSFVLLVAGVYPLATYAVSSVRFLLMDITNIDLILDIAQVVGPLGIGVVIGILFMARILSRVIKRQSKAVYLVVLGLMLGSVYALLWDPVLFQSGFYLPFNVIGFVSCALGGLLSYKLGVRGLR